MIKCYRNNADSCCISAHDSQIATEMSNFLSTSCERRFPELEYYFCYGCHYTEPDSTDTTNKKIRLCKDFAERLWGEDIDKSTTKFDSCGFMVGGEVVIPSSKWADGNAFFAERLPPLFSDYTIEIVNGDEDCFNRAVQQGLSLSMIVLAIMLY